MRDMRCVDVLNSIVMLGGRDARVYNKMAHNAKIAIGYATPSALARLPDIVPSGEATLIPLESTAAYKKYHVSFENGEIRKPRIAIPDLSNRNYSLFLNTDAENRSCASAGEGLIPL